VSHEDGWAAINLEMPARVPRTEYSLEGHYEALKAITGIHVTVNSPKEIKTEAAHELWRRWNYDFFWATGVGGDFGKWKTDMGHAEYAAGGGDRREIGTCPFKTPEEVLAFDPREQFERADHAELVKEIEDSYKSQCENWPDGVHMTGTYTTCISGLIAMLGWDMLLLAAGTDPKRFGGLTNRYCEWFQQYMDALADADIPLVMIHDDMVWTAGPFIHPDWYRKYVFPNFKKYFTPIRESGTKIMFTSDGDFTEFIDDLVEAGVTGFVLEPTTDMALIAEKYGKTHSFIGNADTRVLLLGSKAEIRAEVERCMAIGKSCPGFFLAVGNHIPPNTPVDSVLYYNEVYEELSKR
jgi:uroporphyrinogen-III decarboxylase